MLDTTHTNHLIDVPEDVHGAELSEADGAVERQHPLPDVLGYDNRFDILVDGISFIEKLSFNAFNEGTSLIYCLKMHKRLFRVEAKKVGEDTGYAGTDNMDYCKKNGIQTSFVKRG